MSIPYTSHETTFATASFWRAAMFDFTTILTLALGVAVGSMALRFSKSKRTVRIVCGLAMTAVLVSALAVLYHRIGLENLKTALPQIASLGLACFFAGAIMHNPLPKGKGK